jgi:hypothetical protein
MEVEEAPRMTVLQDADFRHAKKRPLYDLGATAGREEETERPDAGFFEPHFSVPLQHWLVSDRIEAMGFVYLHRETVRPLAITRALSRADNTHAGYIFCAMLERGPAEKCFALAHCDEIPLTLELLHEQYLEMGAFASDAEAEACHTAFADAMNFQRVEPERRLVRVNRTKLRKNH